MQPNADQAPTDPLRAADQWFAARGWQPFEFQTTVWRHYLDGRSGLIHSPTGTGKTLAAWFGPLLEALHHGDGVAESARVLWITPLRALAADTQANLQSVLRDMPLAWDLEHRTGDTSASARARQKKRLPSALVTTPESLSLLLSYPDAAKRFSQLRCVVVDEWHELLSTKRGVLLELALARLRTFSPAVRTWGLSATIGNTRHAMDVLLGADHNGELVSGDLRTRIEVESLRPDQADRFPWAGHVGVRLLPQVMQAIDSAGSTLLFTNTRSQAELWHQALTSVAPGFADQIALHHGSVDREQRNLAEAGLKDGSLRCVVATSSLDLGVDFTPVEQVIQVGSPKGVARLMQRAGRSGHQPGKTSRVLCVPTHGMELVEIAAARSAIQAGRIEPREAAVLQLDVLSQHVVSCALGGGFRHDDLLSEVRTTHAFSRLSERQWDWVLKFVTHGGDALKSYPEYYKVVEKSGVYRVPDQRIGRRHRMSIGTITSDGALSVRFVKGSRLGSIEESFLSRLKTGDRFLFSGRVLELVRIRDMVAYVRLSKGKHDALPRWQGGRLPLSSQLSFSLREKLDAASRGVFDGPEMACARPLLELQARWSALPRIGQVLVEIAQSREGTHVFVFPFAGRRVHEGLAAVLAWRLANIAPASFTFSINDYGMELLSPRPPELCEAVLRAALTPENLVEDILSSINATEMARRKFRDIARVAGLVFQGFPGQGKSTRQVQASSGLIYDVLHRYDKDNLLIQQAHREILENELDTRRLKATLERIEDEQIVLRTPERFTPLAFPLWVDRQQHQLSTETWKDRVQRMAQRLERAADG